MPTCYVTTPFGVKPSRDTGQVVDYDHVYQSAIRPAAEFAGCTLMHADDYTSGGIFHKSILRMGIAPDVFIANLGDGNANVMYEVGVRHASRRGIASRHDGAVGRADGWRWRNARNPRPDL